MPLTGGFVAKLQVFAATVDAELYYLAIVGVLAAVVAAFFYLRVVVTMFSGGESPEEAGASGAADVRARQRSSCSPSRAAITLVVGILPGAFLDLAKDATFLL